MTDSTSDKKLRVAILVDAETVSVDNWPAISRVFAGLGDATILICVGDFTNPGPARWLDICRRNGGTAVLVLKTGGRNGSDIALTIEAMDLINGHAAEMIVIVSSDSDFAPLARKITAAGLISVGIGTPTATEGLRRAFDRYLLLPDADCSATPSPLAPKPETPSQKPVLTAEEIDFLSALVVRLCREQDGGSVPLSQIGLTLRNENPALADRLTRGRLRLALGAYNLADEQGKGTAIRMVPRPAAHPRNVA